MQTYDEILQRMSEKYRELTGIKPFEASDIGVRLRVLSGEIYSIEVYLEWLRRQMKITTAEGEWLDYHAQQRGIKRFEAENSEGDVVFSLENASESDVLVPKGTVVAVGKDSEYSFETTEEGVIYAGTLSAHIRVRAVNSGKAYNVRAEAVDSVVTPLPVTVSVRNPDSFEGGCDRESDESLRKRVAESLSNASSAANCAYYRNAATACEGVASACVVPRERGAGTVDVYIAAQGADVTDEVLEKVQQEISLKREVNVSVLVKKAQPITVNYYLEIELKDGYEFTEVKEECERVLRDFVAQAQVGSKLMLTKAGEQIFHIDGVEDYSLRNNTNRDIKLHPSQYAVLGGVVVKEGIG